MLTIESKIQILRNKKTNFVKCDFQNPGTT